MTDEEPAATQRLWRALVGAVELLVRFVGKDVQDGAGMPLAAFEILVRLGEAPSGTLRMSELAACARSSRSRLTHTVDRLETVGWVRREQCPSDRRGAFAVLTEEGAAALAAARPVVDASVARHLLAALTIEDRRRLAHLSAQLLAHLDAEEDGCPRAGEADDTMEPCPSADDGSCAEGIAGDHGALVDDECRAGLVGGADGVGGLDPDQGGTMSSPEGHRGARLV